MTARKAIMLMLVIFICAGCARKRFDREALSVTSRMDMERLIGQMIMVAVPGTRMNRQIEAILDAYHPGGVILFGYNLSSRRETADFIRAMQDRSLRASGVPLFVSIDQEGGRVVRITDGVTQFPGAMAAGIAGDGRLSYRWGRVVGLQLRRIGINMNLAPVLDVNNNPGNPVINTRAFGSDPDLVARLGAAYVRGLQESRCLAVGKHFPGHGDTDRDSHVTLPVIRYGMDRLNRIELIPFRKAIAAGVEGIMTAHIAYPAILGGMEPATVSGIFLDGLLRKRFGFSGLVITDDMEMHAISRRQDMGEAAVRSVLAGADIILISSYEKSIPAITRAIGRAVREKRIPPGRIEASVRRIIEAKIRYGIMSVGEGVPGCAAFAITPGEEKILAGADDLNRTLSREGILMFGRKDFAAPGRTMSRFFITADPRLGNELARVSTNRVCATFAEFVRRAPGAEGAVLYLHVAGPLVGYVRSVARHCAAKGYGLVLVATGNPFPLTVSGAVTSGILTFSNTDESIRQLGRCLNGEFRPKSGGLLLGTGGGR